MVGFVHEDVVEVVVISFLSGVVDWLALSCVIILIFFGPPNYYIYVSFLINKLFNDTIGGGL